MDDLYIYMMGHTEIEIIEKKTACDWESIEDTCKEEEETRKKHLKSKKGEPTEEPLCCCTAVLYVANKIIFMLINPHMHL